MVFGRLVVLFGLFVLGCCVFGFCLLFPSRFRDHFSSLQERTTVGAVMARTAWEKKKKPIAVQETEVPLDWQTPAAMETGGAVAQRRWE